MNIICLDAEFADNEELLELSIYDNTGEEIYHSYYCPEKIRQWKTDIHHITPEMVTDKPTFGSERSKVGAIMKAADIITGFAVDNDLRVLSRSGIGGLDDKPVLDVKDMYWYSKGRETGMSPYSVPSLIVCANALGLEFDEETAHSASTDTLYTLRCFTTLLDVYRNSRADGGEEDRIIADFMEDIENAKAEYIKEGAKGFVRVYKTADAYKLKYSHQNDEESGNLVMEVEVADRYKAEYELRKLLKKKEVAGKYSTYKLTAKLLDEIRRYRNEYGAEESAWCKKIIRNLSKLTL